MIALSMVTELLHADRGTDSMMNPTVAFRHFAKARNKNKRSRRYMHKRNIEVVSRNFLPWMKKEHYTLPLCVR